MDDGISIKSGLNEAGREFGVPSENIHIENVTVHPMFDNLSTNGISIGSEMSGSVRNVTVKNVTIHSCESGIYIKSMEGRGGVVEDVKVEDVVMNTVLQGLRLSMNYMYRRGRRGLRGEANSSTPHFRNIAFKNITGTNVLEAGFIVGLKQSVIRNVSLTNVSLESKLGWTCFSTTGTFANVEPAPPLKSASDKDDEK